MKNHGNVTVQSSLLVLLFLLPLTVFAVPYVPLEQAELEANLRASTIPVGPNRVQLDDLDEFGYTYPVEYFQLLSYLTEMQVSETGTDFGGMREGEQDLDIIQTDNTQEALRDWSRYGFLTGDTSRFHQNIEDAWTYTLNWPAYLEEGGGNPNYYRVHNCGWGLVAYMEYANTYGENETYLAYADSCARYIDRWRLEWSGVGVELNPLVAGYGAGTLYLYGVYRDNSDWISSAQEIAEEVAEWINSNPNRLNANESWAMSGGTAMWGVVTALYQDDPDGAAAWIPTVSSYMDTYSGTGQWNNSWTVWYGHAWNAIHQVLGDQESYDNLLEVTDFLLDQDEIDDDGLIPATENRYQNDQSWTSAYLAWYCLEYIMNQEDDDYDVVAEEILQPAPGWDWWVDQPVPDALISVANGGMLTLEGDHNFSVTADIGGTQVLDAENLELDFGRSVLFDFTPDYIPSSPGTEVFRVIVNTSDDGDTSNDTLEVEYNVVRTYLVTGVVGAADGGILESEIIWTLNGSDPIRSDTLSTTDGEYMFYLAEGEYTLEVIPYDAPYPPVQMTYSIPDDPSHFDFNISRLDVLFVSEEGNLSKDVVVLDAFENSGNEAYYWPIPEKGRPNDTLFTVEAVFWTTGDSGQVLAEESQTLYMQNFLESGKSILLSGTNLMDVMGGSTFFQDYFGADDGNNNLQGALYAGVVDAPISQGDGMVVDIPAAQNLPDGINPFYSDYPANRGQAIFTNAYTQDTMAVAYEDLTEGFKSVLLGFGIEQIMVETGGQYMELDTFIGRTLEWFGVSSDVPGQGSEELLPNIWSLNTWPNPFNPTVSIRVGIPAGQTASLQLFDILGRQVKSWEKISASGSTLLQWDGSHHSSGVYFLLMESGNETLTRKIMLLR